MVLDRGFTSSNGLISRSDWSWWKAITDFLSCTDLIIVLVLVESFLISSFFPESLRKSLSMAPSRSSQSTDFNDFFLTVPMLSSEFRSSSSTFLVVKSCAPPLISLSNSFSRRSKVTFVFFGLTFVVSAGALTLISFLWLCLCFCAILW